MSTGKVTVINQATHTIMIRNNNNNNNNNSNNNNNKIPIAHLEFSMRLQLHMIKKNDTDVDCIRVELADSWRIMKLPKCG